MGIARQEDIDSILKRLDGLENRVSQGFSELKEYLIGLESVVLAQRGMGKGDGIDFRKYARNLFSGIDSTPTPISLPASQTTELKEYLIALETSMKGLRVLYSTGGGGGACDAKVVQQPIEKSAEDLFKIAPEKSNIDERIAALEAEVAFLKTLPPSLMESLGYKKN
jgi:hypothetical protein